MSINILHISDLHFRAPSEHDKNIYYSDSNFCAEFVDYIKKIGKVDYLIFTGDAINQGYVKAFEDAKLFLEKIIDELKIDKKHVILCMGNHDFDRHELELEAKEIPSTATDKQERLNNIHTSDNKYKYFKNFVSDILGKKLNVKDAIYDCIIDDDNKFLLLGVNSCYLESFDTPSHKGMIDKDQFIYKLNELLNGKLDYSVFLAMHHNPAVEASGDEVRTWKDILNCNKAKNPIVVFSGHIHYIGTEIDVDGKDGKSEAETTRRGTYYFSAGSLLNTEYKSRSFNMYEIESKTITYHFHTHINSEEKPYWEETNKNTINLNERDFSSDTVEQVRDGLLSMSPTPLLESYPSLMDYIGKHQLFYSGHFHWNTDENTGESDFKSLGYIDINYLVSHIESLEIITQLFSGEINDIKKKNQEMPGKTLVVSIGMECSVIGARLSVLFPEYDFSYIPRKRKASDHNDIEQKIGLEIDRYDTIILIKDVIVKTSKGETEEIIRDLFYGKNIHLISLFYCGSPDKKKDILKGIDNAQFHSLIDDIKITICGMSESNCPIIKNKLQTIYRC
jgi:3',5'-cyclic AMP phosphodiesterase CpdA